jgi:dienelactone hydrolase
MTAYSLERTTLSGEPDIFGDPDILVDLLSAPTSLGRRPVILMLGSLDADNPPAWSVGLLDEGYLLCAFAAQHAPDPDPARRSVFLYFDQRFAHSYAFGGRHAPPDAARVIDHLLTRDDVHPGKIGWLGSSSSGIPGLSVACHEPRLAALVVFVSTGAYHAWLDSWQAHGLWQGDDSGLWPETDELLASYDPVLHVAGLYPTALLMVGGGDDKVVDPATNEVFCAAARPHYAHDPDRLRHVVYQGCGHNLPADVVRTYAESWFHLYLHPTSDAPLPVEPPASLEESVIATQINAADHRDVVGAR